MLRPGSRRRGRRANPRTDPGTDDRWASDRSFRRTRVINDEDPLPQSGSGPFCCAKLPDGFRNAYCRYFLALAKTFFTASASSSPLPKAWFTSTFLLTHTMTVTSAFLAIL